VVISMVDFENTNGDMTLKDDGTDFSMVDGEDEFAQSCGEVLGIGLGSMPDLAPDCGTSRINLLGKNVDDSAALEDITTALQDQEPRVDYVENMVINHDSDRHSTISLTIGSSPDSGIDNDAQISSGIGDE